MESVFSDQSDFIVLFVLGVAFGVFLATYRKKAEELGDEDTEHGSAGKNNRFP